MSFEVGATELIAIIAIAVTVFFGFRNQAKTEKIQKEIQEKADEKEKKLELKAAEKESELARWSAIQKMAEQNMIDVDSLRKDHESFKFEQMGKYATRPELSELEGRLEKKIDNFHAELKAEFEREHEQLKELLIVTIRAELAKG